MTSFNPVWDQIFSTNRRWNKYPPEELVRFFAAHFFAVEPRSELKILEVGCGPGSGASQFVAREGFNFYGIDGSAVAIERAQKMFSELGLSGQFKVSDIDALPFPNDTFDAIIDVCCLQCNSEKTSAVAIAEILRVLKPGGRHFSLTAKAGSWGDGTGERLDQTTVRNPTDGPYVGMGSARYATEESLRSLYQGFEELKIDFSIRSVEEQKFQIGHWQLQAKKPL